MCPATSSGLRLVCASISATRFSVGRTIGSLSVQLFSRNRLLQVVVGVGVHQSRRGALELDFLQMIAFGWAGESFDDFLHHWAAADRALAVDVRS